MIVLRSFNEWLFAFRMSVKCLYLIRFANEAWNAPYRSKSDPVPVSKFEQSIVSSLGWVSTWRTLYGSDFDLSKLCRVALSLSFFFNWRHKGWSWRRGVLRSWLELYREKGAGSFYDLQDAFLLPQWSGLELPWTCVMWIMEIAPSASFLGSSPSLPLFFCYLALPFIWLDLFGPVPCLMRTLGHDTWSHLNTVLRCD